MSFTGVIYCRRRLDTTDMTYAVLVHTTKQRHKLMAQISCQRRSRALTASSLMAHALDTPRLPVAVARSSVTTRRIFNGDCTLLETGI